MSRGGTGVRAVNEGARACGGLPRGDRTGPRAGHFRRDRGRGPGQAQRRRPGDDRGHRARRPGLREPSEPRLPAAAGRRGDRRGHPVPGRSAAGRPRSARPSRWPAPPCRCAGRGTPWPWPGPGSSRPAAGRSAATSTCPRCSSWPTRTWPPRWAAAASRRWRGCGPGSGTGSPRRCWPGCSSARTPRRWRTGSTSTRRPYGTGCGRSRNCSATSCATRIAGSSFSWPCASAR